MNQPKFPLELLTSIIAFAVRKQDWQQLRHLRLVDRFFADEVDRHLKLRMFGSQDQQRLSDELQRMNTMLLGRLVFEELGEHQLGPFSRVLKSVLEILGQLRVSTSLVSRTEDTLDLCILAAKKEPVALVLNMVRCPPWGYYDCLKYDPSDEKFPRAFAQALAASTGDLKLLQAVSDVLQDFRYQTSWFSPPLLLAAENGHLECVSYLLDNDALDEGPAGPPGMEYVWAPNLISRHRGFQHHESSLAMYSDYDPQDYEYENAASKAARRGNVEMLQLIFDHESAGGTKHFHTPNWAVALEEAVRAGNMDSVRFIINVTDDHCLSSMTHRGFTQAARCGRFDFMDLIFEKSNLLDNPFGLDTELWEAAWRGNTKVVSWLLNHGVKPEQIRDALKKNVLLAAVWHGIPELVKPLAGVMDPNEPISHPLFGGNTQTLLSITRQKQRKDIETLLTEHGANAKQNTGPRGVVASVVKAIRR